LSRDLDFDLRSTAPTLHRSIAPPFLRSSAPPLLYSSTPPVLHLFILTYHTTRLY